MKSRLKDRKSRRNTFEMVLYRSSKARGKMRGTTEKMKVGL
jgi:hypothetical protein